MLADEKADYADLVRRVADVVSLAHPRGVAVEAELGVLPSEKGTGTFCAKHPEGRSGKRCLSPFPPTRRR